LKSTKSAWLPYHQTWMLFKNKRSCQQIRELLNAKCYDEITVKVIEKEITTLSTKLKTMEDQELEAAKKAEQEKVEAQKKEAKLAAEKEKAEKLEAEQLTAAKLKADKEKAEKDKKELPEPIKEKVEEEEKKKKAGLGALFAGLAAILGISGDDTIYDPKTPVLDPPTPKKPLRCKG